MRKSIKIIFLFVAVLILISGALLYFTKRKNVSDENRSGNSATQNTVSSLQNNAGPTGKTESSANQSVIDINDSSKNISLPGKQTDSQELINKYGKYAFEAFQKNPALIDRIKSLDQNFQPSQMDPSFLSHVYKLDNGKEYLTFGGCTAHNCAGTGIIVIYNEKGNEIYMAKENDSQTQLQLIGNPPEEERDLLIYYYFHR